MIENTRMIDNMRDTQTLVFIGNKGGAGRSKTAASLAMDLAERGYKVLVIDSDDQFHITTSDFKVEPSQVSATNYNGYLTQLYVERNIKKMYLPFNCNQLEWHEKLQPRTAHVEVGEIHLIAGATGTEEYMNMLFERYDSQNKKGFYDAYAENFQLYRGYYDFIIIDTPPASKTRIPNNLAISVADWLIMVTDGEEAATGNIKYLNVMTESLFSNIGVHANGVAGQKPKVLFVMAKVKGTDYRTKQKIFRKLHCEMCPKLKSAMETLKSRNGRLMQNIVHAALLTVFGNVVCEASIPEDKFLKDHVYDDFKQEDNRYHKPCSEILKKIRDNKVENVFDSFAVNQVKIERLLELIRANT